MPPWWNAIPFRECMENGRRIRISDHPMPSNDENE
jgi:hypothetical protein